MTNYSRARTKEISDMHNSKRTLLCLMVYTEVSLPKGDVLYLCSSPIIENISSYCSILKNNGLPAAPNVTDFKVFKDVDASIA